MTPILSANSDRWSLIVVAVQFASNMIDRRAAEAVRARIDWKYCLGMELDDPGFDFSVLSKFRSRLINRAWTNLCLMCCWRALVSWAW